MTSVSGLGGAGTAQGGIPVVNRLLLAALAGCAGPKGVVSVHDVGPGFGDWAPGWEDSYGAAGSRVRFLAAAWARRGLARGSVVFATHLGLAPAARMVGRGGRVAVFLHGVEAWQPLRRRDAWGLRRCSLVIANSAMTLERFRRANPAFAALPGEVCHLPVRTLDGPASGAVQGLDRPGPRVVVVGRLWGRGLRKGQRELIAVWPELLKEFPTAELWVVGGGAGGEELQRLARSAGVGRSVVFPGEVSDPALATIYSRSVVFAMPSWGEGFGLVFAEAMAHGLPCICSRYDGGSEVVAEGETGFQVDPERPAELLGALRRLLGDPGLQAEMGRAGRERVRRLFSYDRFRGRIQEVLLGQSTRR